MQIEPLWKLACGMWVSAPISLSLWHMVELGTQFAKIAVGRDRVARAIAIYRSPDYPLLVALFDGEGF
jgi:hypothetical protein